MAITQETAHAAVLGRRLGIATFWLMAAWVVGACCYSVMGHLFFFEQPMSLPANGYDCHAKLGRLESRLMDDAAQVLKSHERAAMEQAMHGWDHDFTEARARCGDLGAVSADLQSLRLSLEDLLREHRETHLPVRRRIREVLDALHPGAESPTEES